MLEKIKDIIPNPKTIYKLEQFNQVSSRDDINTETK